MKNRNIFIINKTQNSDFQILIKSMYKYTGFLMQKAVENL